MADAEKILFIDDDAFFISILASAFSKHGYEVLSELDGIAGLETARAKKPRIILLDLDMKGIDGYTTLTRLKADAATANIPVVIFSNSSSKKEIDRARDGGALDHLVKMNFTPEQLVARIEEFLA